MTARDLYTRVYSSTSAGNLISARGTNDRPLSTDGLLYNFNSHSDSRNRIPTALVSVSDRIVDTIKRAFDKYLNGEDPEDIWLAFIDPQIYHWPEPRIHRAQELAEAFGHPKPGSFSHELLFEWEIPQSCVIHEVPLAIVMEHPWCLHEYFVGPASTREVRDRIADEIMRLHPQQVGYTLGRFAWAFGTEAPVKWIAHRLFYDCKSNPDLIDVDGQHVLDGIEVGLVEGSFVEDARDELRWQSDFDDDHGYFDQGVWIQMTPAYV